MELIESILLELEGILIKGTFRTLHGTKLPENARVFGSSFMPELKRAEHGTLLKSRLVVTSKKLLQFSPSRKDWPRTLPITTSSTYMKMFTQDVIQAYVQSKTDLENK